MPRPIATNLHIDRRAHKIVAQSADETGNADDLLNVAETADYLDVSPQWLAIRRGQNNGPKFKRVGARKIMYRAATFSLGSSHALSARPRTTASGGRRDEAD